MKAMLWGAFAAGGMVAALFYPAQLFVMFLLWPTDALKAPDYTTVHALFTNWIFRLYLLVFISLPLFHVAHRIMAAFMDFGLRPFRKPVALLLYGGAAIGTALTIVTLVTM
ncbi:MAG: succinate dehydrogenase/fumarate reductase transmembrane subunit [Planctomycetota bacterium]|jgi:fumarate reductase subunit D